MCTIQPRTPSEAGRLVDVSDVAVLLLPAMSLNGTEFPRLGLPSLCVDYADLGTWAREGAGLRPYVQMLRASLVDQPEWQRARRRIVVGHSFGGMLALEYLLRHAEPQVDGLVLISASAGPLFERVRLQVPGLRSRVPAGKLLKLWNSRVATLAMKALFGLGRLKSEHVDFQALSGCSDAAIDRAGWRNTDWRQMRAMRSALDGFDVRQRLGAISAPTIVLHGSADPLFEATEARFLAKHLPNAQLRIVIGGGHTLPLSHPEAVRTAVWDLVLGASRLSGHVAECSPRRSLSAPRRATGVTAFRQYVRDDPTRDV